MDPSSVWSSTSPRYVRCHLLVAHLWHLDEQMIELTELLFYIQALSLLDIFEDKEDACWLLLLLNAHGPFNNNGLRLEYDKWVLLGFVSYGLWNYAPRWPLSTMCGDDCIRWVLVSITNRMSRLCIHIETLYLYGFPFIIPMIWKK